MAQDPRFSRRRFFKLCASAITLISASPQLLAEKRTTSHPYRRVQLVDSQGQAITADSLETGENYLFHYPYVTTPCFLLNLGEATPTATQLKTESGDAYQWNGGVGPQRSIVAFSAICSHRMTHPARSVSFINYRHDQARFQDADKQSTERAQVIYCCSEKSVYDPTRGAQVLGGPAPQPLAAIALEYDDDDSTLYATGTYGGEMFEKFFNNFGMRLSLEFRTSDIRKEVSDTATVITLAEYCQTQVMC